MPEMIPLGWLHTVIGVIALVSGVISLVRDKEIGYGSRAGQIYLVTTFITAATASIIYQRGVFHVAHLMAVATLVALAVGLLAAALRPFGRWSRHIQAFSLSATILFHVLPTATDFLLRLPPGDPIVDSVSDPVMQMSHLALLVLFLGGLAIQLRWF